ncbi:MAG: kinase [Syntrophales bacterium LBB04]|nr:kinase [Syntrophales bacterium LBB04]
MIITRTPFRLSLFGGGTDFPAWYRDNGGVVLSTTIDKYCYISCRFLPPFFSYKHRIVYSHSEQVNGIDEIQHPAVRETFRFMGVDKGLELHHDGDLPARSGIGSSSAFTVGLLHALYGLSGKIVSKKRLAMESIHIEQNMIRENVGSQDQVAVAFGGLNKIIFKGDHDIEVIPITINTQRLNDFQNHLMLFFTGLTRYATDIEEDKIRNIADRKREMDRLSTMVEAAIDILNSEGDFDDFGKMLHESWLIKKSLSAQVSTGNIDELYGRALKKGALGGKLLGAGGGGFILFYVRPEQREAVKQELSQLLNVPFRFDALGSQIIYYREGV